MKWFRSTDTIEMKEQPYLLSGTVNKREFIYKDGIVPMEYEFNNRRRQNLPDSIRESKEIPLGSLIKKTIKSKEQRAIDTGLIFDLLPRTHGIIEVLRIKTIKKLWIAPRILLRGNKTIKALAANLTNKKIIIFKTVLI